MENKNEETRAPRRVNTRMVIVISVVCVVAATLLIWLFSSLVFDTDAAKSTVTQSRTVPADMVMEDGRFVMLDYDWDFDLEGCYETHGAFEDMEIEAPELPEVTDEDVENAVYQYVSSNGTWEKRTEGTASVGDVIEVSYSAWQNDRAVSDFTADHYVFELGNAEEPDDFVVALDGAQIGETLSFDVVMPDDSDIYGTYAGKTLQFEAEIHAVCTVPEITDDNVVDVSGGYYSTADSFLSDIRTYLELLVLDDYEDELYTAVWDALKEWCSVSEVPDDFLAWYISMTLMQYQDLADSEGMAIGDYLEYVGLGSVDSFIAYCCENAMDGAEDYVILEAASRELGLVFDPEEDADYYDARLSEIVSYFGMRTDEAAEAYYGVSNIEHDARDAKLINMLLERAASSAVGENE